MFGSLLGKRLRFVAAAVLAALLLPGAYAASAPAAESTYIVQLAEPPLALYGGGIAGLAPTMPAARGATRLDATAPASVAYLTHLTSRQNAVKSAIDTALGRTTALTFRYRAAYNGFAVDLTESEAQRVSSLAGVKRVQADERRALLTDHGPAWIGAGGVYDGSATGSAGTKGEGIVAGIIDTGINNDHPSFADLGGDGFNHSNPRTRHYGVCAPLNPVLCNDKLIGMYDFTGTTPFDDNAHGSHTASTVAGNVVEASLVAPTLTYTKRISGVAPHANLISYKACNSLPAVGGCLVSATVAAIDQATLDQVDVINFSIGGASRNPWTDPNALAFLGATAAGVFASVSAGNDGPGSSTIGSPSDSPWVMSVGAATHDRALLSQLTDLTGGGTPPATITGKSVASGVGPAPIVYAGDFGAPLCGAGTADPTTGVGSERPFEPGELAGKIVVCDRGTYGRVWKGQEVKDAGGVGMVLANDAANGDSLTADMHVLPAIHITYEDGQALKAWLASGTGHQARITGLVENISPENGDVTASFSSRGPNPSVPGVIKPDVTAPGVDVYAAFNTPLGTVGSTPPEYGIISGTSMSSPHAAGAAALLRKLRPTWTPAQLKSALMTTGFTTLPGNGNEVHGVLKEDATTAATPFEMGGGRVELRRAASAGLLFDVAPTAYLTADPGQGGDPKSLNIASLAHPDCQQTCAWTRTVTAAVAGSWTASTVAPAGAGLTVSPGSFTLDAGESTELTITATNTGLTPNAWRFGSVTFTRSGNGVPPTRLPVAVRATGESVDPCVIPEETVVTDPSNDQLAGHSTAYDIQSLSAAGLYPTLNGSDSANIRWTLKVQQLNPDAVPRNSSWRVVWTFNGTTYFVDMNTFEPTGVKFEYGALDANGIFQTQGAADDGSFTPDGTIKIAIAASKVGGPTSGAELTAVNADAVFLAGGAGTGLLATIDTTANGTYTLRDCGSAAGPNAVNDNAATPQGSPVTIDVLANDTHPQNQQLTVVSATDPPRGETVVNANGTITYTPDAGFSGSDSFTYTVEDPSDATDTATVFVTVEPLCPTGTFTDDMEGGAEPGWQVDTAANALGPLSSTWAVANDPGAKSASNSWFSDATTLDLKDDRLVMPAQDLTAGSLLTFWHRYRFEPEFDGGVLEVSTDDGETWTDVVGAGGVFVTGGYNGAIDPGFGSPIAGRAAWTGGFLDALAAPMTQVTVNVGALASQDVLFRFRLAADPLGVGALPGHGWWIDDVTVTNTALDCPPPPNEPPVAKNDTASTNKSTAVTVNVLANDEDPDGDLLTVAVADQPTNGTATRNGDNTVTYTPNTGFVGTDVFTYEITDGNGGMSTATVTVTVVDASGPTPCFEHSPKKPNKNTHVKFDAACTTDEQSADGQLVFEWDFRSDGTYDATGMSPRHRFGAAGTFTVTLRVTDPGGLSNVTSKQIVVRHDDDDDDDDGPEHGGGAGGDDDGGDD